MLKAIEHRGRDDEGVWTSSVINDEGPPARSWSPAFVHHRHQQRRAPADAVHTMDAWS